MDECHWGARKWCWCELLRCGTGPENTYLGSSGGLRGPTLDVCTRASTAGWGGRTTLTSWSMTPRP